MTSVDERNRFIQCLCPYLGDRWEEKICLLGAPRLRVEAREGPRESAESENKATKGLPA